MSVAPAGRYVLKTLGCKANLYDTQQIEAELRKRGWRALGEQAVPGEPSATPIDLPVLCELPVLCIVNSCTVTDEADRQSRKLAARLSRENPRAKVVVTGCGAEVDPERLANSVGIDYVIGNRDKPALVDMLLSKLSEEKKREKGEVLGAARGYAEIASRHPLDREWALPVLPDPEILARPQTATTRAFLKIQDGCNSFCTYCIIPYGRGPSRSLRPREILASVRVLVAQGIREIVLTGTNLGDYGADWSASGDFQLAELIERLLMETPLERLRASSLDPTEITPKLMTLMAREPRFCPHFHVSLQSPHPRILRLMKRRYGFDEVKRCLEEISRLPAPAGGVFIGMDVITGFPGETEAEFEWGIERLRELPWMRLHVFPFSEREGTPATRISESVRPEERARRARILNEIGQERMLAHHQRVLERTRAEGSAFHGILLEKAPPNLSKIIGADAKGAWAAGYTPNYLRVLVPLGDDHESGRNRIVSARPSRLHLDRVNGDVAFVAEPLETPHKDNYLHSLHR